MSASRVAPSFIAGLIAVLKARMRASIGSPPTGNGATVGPARTSAEEMSSLGAPAVCSAPAAIRKTLLYGRHAVSRRFFRGVMPVAVIAVIAAIGVTGCGGSTAPTRTDAARSLVSVYQSAGVTVSDGEVQCADRKVVAALSDADAGAKKLTDLSMTARGKVANAIDACFKPASIKQVYEKVVAKDAGLSASAAACLAQALVEKKVSYGGVVRQRRKEIEILGNSARACLTKSQG